MKQAPLWLPYRVRNAIDQRRILWALRGVDRTRPYPVADPKQADAEVHMLLCKRDLQLGVMAFKSLLRFDDLKLAGTVLNDGSLTEQDKQWFEKHIPGVRWQVWKMSDPALAAALDTHPNLADLYLRSTYEQIAKMLHPVLTARCPRVIQFDSDTAFFKKPQRIIDFCKGQDDRPLYLHDHQDESTAVPPVVHEAFADLQAKTFPPGRAWGLQHRFFNAGLLIYRPDQMDLGVAEKYLGWRQTAPEKYTTGKPGIWFGTWTPEQTCYHVMYAFADPPPEPLGHDYHLGGEPGHIFNHFLRHYVVRDTTLNLIKQLIKEF